MDSPLIPGVQAQYGKLQDLKPGTWALIPPPKSEGGPLVLVLCLNQIPEDDAAVSLEFRPETPGIYRTTHDDAGMLVLPEPVHADFDPKAMTDEAVPNLGSNPAVLLGFSSRGLLILCMQYADDKRYEGPRTLFLDSLKWATDIPTRVFWTRKFSLRLPGEDGLALYRSQDNP